MKNRALLLFLVAFFSVNAFAQMHVKHHNFSTFSTDKRENTKVLDELSSAQIKTHPEYGITPYNAQCQGCVELLDQRTVDSRQFVDTEKKSRVYSQTSYFPLHYKKSVDDIWRTIDERLQPVPGQPNVYAAFNQPRPTKCDLNKKSTSIYSDGFEFEYNRNLSLYFFDDNTAYTQRQNANYANYTIGDEGLSVKNIFPGIDMQQIFSVGQIKTNFVIPAPLQLPINKGWMVIEDHFTLPAGYSFQEAEGGEHFEGGKYYRGDYVVVNPKGERLFKYEKPVYVDALAFGMHGFYKLINNNGDYTLQILVPIEWLNRKTNTYPLIIDPLDYGFGQYGSFTSSGGPSASMGFTTMSLGSCNYHVIANVPGRTEIRDAYVDVEYSLTYDNMCGNPPLAAPFCTFSQVTMEIQCDTCNTTTGPLKCDPANPPYTGTCTTDSNLVAPARAIRVNDFVPNYVACLPPQCPPYALGFTLLNRDSICGDSCGFLCARGNFWRVTVSACYVEGNITQDKTQVCAGQPVVFTAHPSCGVPPYHFAWSQDGGTTYDTVYGSPNYVVYPNTDVIVSCVIIDTCNKFFIANDLQITVIPTPPANAGADGFLCEGGTVQLGGTPTSSPSATIVWTGENATVDSWLNNAGLPNPVVTVPAGTVDTVYYVVNASNPSCFRTDTVLVYSAANPVAVIDTNGSTSVCANQNVNIAVTGTFASYLWSNGSTSQAISVNQPGSYFAIVTDANGCRDTTNSITVSNITLPTVNVFPDTLIMYGDSVMLSTDLNLNSAVVDSFMWGPAMNISCTTCTNPVVTPVGDQYYNVVVHASGCTISDSALIRVILPNNFYIPNAFTPNGDGNNDNFYIQAQSGVKVLTFQVFNRTGEKIHDGSYPWDGTYKGKPAPAGVYVYIFKLGLFGEEYALFRKGTVTMIR